MHVFMRPKEAAAALGVDPDTVRNWIARGVITHVFTNGPEVGSKGVQYFIDMTKQFGIEPEPAPDVLAAAKKKGGSR